MPKAIDLIRAEMERQRRQGYYPGRVRLSPTLHDLLEEETEELIKAGDSEAPPDEVRIDGVRVEVDPDLSALEVDRDA